MSDRFGTNYYFSFRLDVRIKELDSYHFVIPRKTAIGVGNVLFFVDENNSVKFKSFIKGRLKGDILSEDINLIERKTLLVYDIIEETINLSEYYFYSWDKNCRISDKWNMLYSYKYDRDIKHFLLNKVNFSVELTQEIIRYIKANDLWLAALKVVSNDFEHTRYFISLIGVNGLPLIDLTYINAKYEIETHHLKKETVGEIDEIREILQKKMNDQVFKIEENKKNMTANFFQQVGIPMYNTKNITDTNQQPSELVLKRISDEN